MKLMGIFLFSLLVGACATDFSLSNKMISEKLVDHRQAIFDCYAAFSDPSDHSAKKLELRSSIDGRGVVVNSGVLSKSDALDPRAVQCTKEVVGRIQFEKTPHGRTLVTHLPFHFEHPTKEAMEKIDSKWSKISLEKYKQMAEERKEVSIQRLKAAGILTVSK